MTHQATAKRLRALHYACMVAALQQEKTGSVSEETMEQIRRILNEPSSTKNVAPTDCSTRGEIGQFHQVLAAD